MSKRIKGITIEYAADSSKLTNALKEADKASRSAGYALKGMERALNMNPRNIDLLNRKEDLLKSKINAVRTELDGFNEELKAMDESGVDKTSEEYRRLKAEASKCEEEIKRLNKELRETQYSTSKFGQFTGKLAAAGEKAGQLGQKLRGISTAAGIALGGAAKTTADFDSAMSKVMAVSGATGKEFDALRDKAREMGKNTKFSATESAEAFNYMAMAGWKTDQMLAGIEGVMNLAAASGEDLATTSDIVTDALTAMGYEAGDAGRLANVMAAASANANTNVGMMGETFKYVAPVAGSLGYSMEDVSLATGLMANAGVKASQAGTSLKNIMARMAAPTKQVQGAMEKLGIAITDSNGKARPFRDVMQDLRKKMSGLSETEKTQMANTIAGKNAMAGFLAIVNSTDKDFDKLAGAIDGSSGSAKKMADTMNDNLGGQLTLLKSAIQELGISMGDTLVPMLKKVVEKVQHLVDWFNGLSDSQKTLVTKITMMTAALAPALIGFNKLTSGIDKVSKKMYVFTKGVQNGEGIIGKLGTNAIPKLKSGFSGLSAAMGGIPFAAVAMGAAAAGAVIYGVTDVIRRENIENNKLYQAYEKTAQARKQSITDAQAQSREASIYLDKIEQLNKKENLSAAEKEKMKIYVQQLNKAMGKNVVHIDKETGKIKESTSSIRKKIKALKDEAVAEAYRKNFQGAVQEQVKIEGKLANAEKELAKYKKEAAKGGIDPAEAGKIGELTNNVKALKRAYKNSGAEADMWADKMTGGNNKVKKSAKTTATNVKNTSKQISKAGGDAGKNYTNQLHKKMTPAKRKAALAAKQAADAARRQKTHFRSAGETSGSNLGSGIWSGIKDKTSWLANRMKEFANGVKNKLKAFFHIKSPSRWSRDVIGKNIALGIPEGFDDAMQKVNAKLRSGVRTTMNVMAEPVNKMQHSQPQVNIDYGAMGEAVGNGFENVTIVVQSVLDGKVIAETTAPLMEQRLKILENRNNRKLGLV